MSNSKQLGINKILASGKIETINELAGSLDFEHEWNIGTFKSSRAEAWVPQLLGKFHNIATFWPWANATIYSSEGELKNELWWFKDDLFPHWDVVKKIKNTSIIIELTLRGLPKEGIQNIILDNVGESISCADDIVGIRIKPSGEVRLWIIKAESVDQIKTYIFQMLEQCQITGRDITCESKNL